MKIRNKYLVMVWSWFWRSHLKRDDHDRVVFVKSWRSATIDNKYGSRRTIDTMPWHNLANFIRRKLEEK